MITAQEPDTDTVLTLEEARAKTRSLPYGEIIGAVFPIAVGEQDKAWYRVTGLRPLKVEWLPYTQFQVAPEALANLSKTSIYRLIERDIFALHR